MLERKVELVEHHVSGEQDHAHSQGLLRLQLVGRLLLHREGLHRGRAHRGPQLSRRRMSSENHRVADHLARMLESHGLLHSSRL